MMRVWCAMNQKGGVGKTSLLLHILVTAWLRGLTVTLIDLDPQRSADKWSDLRQKRAKADEPVIVHGMVDELSGMLATARREGVDLVLIDTPAAIDKTMIYAAAAADLIIVPTRTSQLDVDSLEETLETLGKMHALAKAVVVLNAKRAADKATGVRELVEKRFTVPIVSIELEDRADFSRALDAGKGIAEKSPKSKAARELEAVLDWLTTWDSKFDGARGRLSA